MLIFKNLFGRESLPQLTEEALHQAKVRLFQIKLEKESIQAEETKLKVRISRLESEQRELQASAAAVGLESHTTLKAV